MTITIGTRGSKLALWQAYYIEEKLKEAGAQVEIKIIHTKGDKILDRSLSKIGSKGVFTEELEDQLRSGEIDIAVHSAKDLQSSLDEDFEIIAFTEREEVNDVLVSHKELNMESSFTVGTSSTRRVAMLKAFYPHINIVDMRGNLQTRIGKMEAGDCDALLLAYAGVHRMGYHDKIKEKLPVKRFTPAVGQGSVAVESSVNLDKEKRELIIHACNHPLTEICLRAERSFLKEINGGCSIPVFGYCNWFDDYLLELNAGIVSLDGKKIIRVSTLLDDPEQLGIDTAKKLMDQGGKEILKEIRNQLNSAL
ncbi:hydroxymethylbilane synthase [Jiulongibacter sediminis]|uniref:Porphobilinogen deaminase n=1 Tax=Jiulongibacter sediminis TaxID=1605367 RepID=A0A0N8HA41_9BACT|nr:hydroxymethylbilane synthase [Jiulongibacter sediminis]KPM49116.1 porphobilinogen deaminase [Jiulongibacter sediminis]TBX26174.1 porphobilinogen deaminase [Jiulongibacter sediminis]